MANNLFSKPEINALKVAIVGDVKDYAEQIQQNSKDISSLKGDLVDLQNIDFGEWHDDKYVLSYNGNILSYGTNVYSCTDYIDITGLSKIKVYVGITNDNIGLAFYNSEKTYISGVNFYNYSLGDAPIFNIPANAKYLVCTCGYNKKDKFFIKVCDVAAPFIGLWNEYVKLSKLVNDNDTEYTVYDIGTLQDGYVNSSHGRFSTATSYKRTDYVPIQAHKILIISTVKPNVPNVGIAFYDINKTYLGGSDFSSCNIGDEIELDVPNNTKYFVYCAENKYQSNMRVRVKSIGESIAEISKTLTYVPPVNPCEYRDSAECRVFNKILCIGDSLTDGQFDYKTDGTIKEFNDKRYAYPTYLKAISGRDVTNFGDAGKTTVSWFSLHGNEDFSGHDACIIALGRNDAPDVKNVSSSDRITAMNNIIAKVKADNPQIKIFICTQINYYNYSGIDTINNDMKTVVQNNTDCYLLDIHTYGSMKSSLDSYSHCTAVGYMKLAEEIFNYISYVMHENQSEFKNIQFVGTNRAF